MPIGIRDEHDELRLSLQRWSESHCPPAVTRAALDADDDTLPDFWAALGALGVLGIHIPEEFGGQGAGMLELAVVAEELGRVAAPGPWSSTAVVAAVVAGCGGPVMAKEILPGLVDGTVAASLVVPTGAPDGSAEARPGLTVGPGPDGSLLVSGTLRPIPNGATAAVVLAPVERQGATVWALLEADGRVVSRAAGQLRSDPTLGQLVLARPPGGRGAGVDGCGYHRPHP